MAPCSARAPWDETLPKWKRATSHTTSSYRGRAVLREHTGVIAAHPVDVGASGSVWLCGVSLPCWYHFRLFAQTQLMWEGGGHWGIRRRALVCGRMYELDKTLVGSPVARSQPPRDAGPPPHFGKPSTGLRSQEPAMISYVLRGVLSQGGFSASIMTCELPETSWPEPVSRSGDARGVDDRQVQRAAPSARGARRTASAPQLNARRGGPAREAAPTTARTDM